MTKAFNRKSEKAIRRSLRKRMPAAEVILWREIRGRQVLDTKFRRQFSVGPFILDFYAPQIKLAIELDGDSHFKKGRQLRDQQRDAYLREFGIEVIRIQNPEIFDNLDNVVEMLGRKIRELLSSPEVNPPRSPLGKGGSPATEPDNDH